MRKQIETVEDPNLEPGMAAVDIYLPGHTSVFTVTGLAETVIEAAKRAPEPKQHNVATEPEKPVTRPVREPGVALHGRDYVRDTFRTKVFDLIYRTNEYEVLQETRLLERRLRLRQAIGTMPVDRCAKHERLLDQL